MQIIIPGTPKSQKRHRTSRGRRYDPSATDKKNIQKSLLTHRNKKLIDYPVSVEIVAYYPFLKSWSKKTRAMAEGGLKITKPDVDNISKLYLDSMNGMIWTDDNLVTDLIVRKRYSQEPCVVIDIEKV
jgi:Holliday junction resolvase RusA-like endonuclease